MIIHSMDRLKKVALARGADPGQGGIYLEPDGDGRMLALAHNGYLMAWSSLRVDQDLSCPVCIPRAIAAELQSLDLRFNASAHLEILPKGPGFSFRLHRRTDLPDQIFLARGRETLSWRQAIPDVAPGRLRHDPTLYYAPEHLALANEILTCDADLGVADFRVQALSAGAKSIAMRNGVFLMLSALQAESFTQPFWEASRCGIESELARVRDGRPYVV